MGSGEEGVPAHATNRRVPVADERFHVSCTCRRVSDVHAVSIPAGSYSGDFYWMQERSDGLCFVLGDVAGKGLHAAIVTSLVVENLEALPDRPDLLCMVDLVSSIHTMLLEELPSNRFVTLVAGHLGHDGMLRLVNAGHCPPLVARKNGGVEIVPTTGPVVGILPGARWRSAEAQLEPGDHLVLYSDGLLEARSPDGDEFGLHRIRASVAAQSERSPRGIVAALAEAAADHRAGTPADDDMTLMALRRPE